MNDDDDLTITHDPARDPFDPDLARALAAEVAYPDPGAESLIRRRKRHPAA